LKRLIIISLISIPILANSQSKDFRLWVGANATKTFDKKYIVNVGTQARFDQNATNLYRYLIQTRLQYKPTKYYKVGLNYRFSDWGITNTNRIDLDNFLRHSVDKETMELRVRLQREFGLNTTLEDRIRFRFAYTHKFSKRLNVYGKAEYFYSSRFNLQTWDMQRYTAGTRFRVALGHFFNVFYRYEFEQNVEAPEHRFVFGTMYNFKF